MSRRAKPKTPSLADIRCGCGSSEIMAIKPGQDGERQGVIDFFTRRDPLVSIPIADVAWCFGCWSRRFVCAEVA